MLDIWSFLLQTLTVSGVAALILVIKAMFKDKLSPKWQFAVWSVLGIIMLLPAGMFGRYTLFRWQLIVEIVKSWFGIFSFTRVLFPIPIIKSVPQTIAEWIFAIYVLGILVFIIQYLISYFNINTVSILPSFIGYLLFLSAINHLCDEEPALTLLRTLVITLTVWHIASWLASWVSIDLDGMLQVVDIMIGVVNIYFHFQLLTNLASIAAKHQAADDELDAKLIRYRTLQTVMLTAVIIMGYLTKWLPGPVTAVSFGMIIIYLIAGILLMKALFNLRRSILQRHQSA